MTPLRSVVLLLFLCCCVSTVSSGNLWSGRSDRKNKASEAPRTQKAGSSASQLWPPWPFSSLQGRSDDEPDASGAASPQGSKGGVMQLEATSPSTFFFQAMRSGVVDLFASTNYLLSQVKALSLCQRQSAASTWVPLFPLLPRLKFFGAVLMRPYRGRLFSNSNFLLLLCCSCSLSFLSCAPLVHQAPSSHRPSHNPAVHDTLL